MQATTIGAYNHPVLPKLLDSAEVSQIASDVIDKKASRPFDSFLERCTDEKCHHIRYEVTISSVSQVSSSRLALLQNEMPFLTKLTIRACITNSDFDRIVSQMQNLQSLTVQWSPELQLHTLNWPPHLRTISFSYP